MDRIIQVKGLSKAYGSVQAVSDVSFYVERGKLFAFLGPNGAGKSTTIDIICTFLKPDKGEISVDGHIVGRQDSEIRRSIGAVFQDSLLDNLLTVEENLRTRGAFYGLKGKALSEAVEKALAAVNITDLANRPYGKLSGGQRRRCDIARALVNTPKILFLDEPTTGLDPQTRKAVWNTILRLQQETGMTVFLTTHYMEEAAEADYVIVIDNGRIAAKGTPAALKEQYAGDCLTLVCSDMAQAKRVLDERGAVYTQTADVLVVSIGSTLDAIPLAEACLPYISCVEITAGTMDDAFIGITGKEIRE